MIETTLLTKRRAAAITRRIEAWFAENAREFPWRDNRSGYAALVSELMLQQTQADRVVDYFNTFMTRFPTLEDLAAAEEQEVLATWQGLGYYRRARYLHAAARKIVHAGDGQFPSTIKALMQLPGVGRYTAGSIASIIFSKREPIVDGNVKRIAARLFANDNSPDESATINWTWNIAQQLVEVADVPGRLNEGLMELGARICTPKKPKCSVCPLKSLCEARKQHLVDAIPPPRVRAQQQLVVHHAIVVQNRDQRRVFVEQRPDTGLWASMWQVPTFEETSQLNIAMLRKRVIEHLGSDIVSLIKKFGFDHQTTHRRIRFVIYESEVNLACVTGAAGRWVSLENSSITHLPMSNPQRKIIEACVKSAS